MTQDRGGLVPRTVRGSVPRDNIPQPRDLRPTRGWLTVVLGVAAFPAAFLANAVGIDDRAAFAVLWAAAALLQVPRLEGPWDWIATGALALYLASFVLPVAGGLGVGPGAAGGSPTLGYQVLVEPPVRPLPRLPPGELLAAAVGVTSWLANPALIVGLAFFRYREATWALVVACLGAGMGAMELAGMETGLAHVAWFGSLGLLALASAWARTEF